MERSIRASILFLISPSPLPLLSPACDRVTIRGTDEFREEPFEIREGGLVVDAPYLIEIGFNPAGSVAARCIR